MHSACPGDVMRASALLSRAPHASTSRKWDALNIPSTDVRRYTTRSNARRTCRQAPLAFRASSNNFAKQSAFVLHGGTWPRMSAFTGSLSGSSNQRPCDSQVFG